ncbi:hypothetical protein [Actinoplanes sp. NPDC049802]|uniref:hypothetical protein n=1 Tax=Actinoplanes sp. NPDC049802 TaxID=3154742 RepID=UPI0033C1DA98
MTRLLWMVPVVLLLAVAGCTEEERAAAPAPSTGAAPAASAPPSAAPETPAVTKSAMPVVTPPAAVDGEVGRRVYTAGADQGKGTTVLSSLPRKGQEYEARAACSATAAGRSLTVVVRSSETGSSGRVFLEGDVPCDGAETAIGWTAGAGVGPVAVGLEGVQPGIESAYAVLVPVAD